MYTYIYIYIYICIYIVSHRMREMGAAPRNPAPGNHSLVWIVKPSGCHCADENLTSRIFAEG